VAFSAVVGVALSGALVGLMLLFHYQPAGRNLMLWYWPAWLAPCFPVGGFLARNVRAPPPNSLSPPKPLRGSAYLER
jgi:hypothetical protein